jgi:hypothetical protein
VNGVIGDSEENEEKEKKDLEVVFCGKDFFLGRGGVG